MRIRHFRRFRQNGPFLAGDKNTVYQKHGLCDPEMPALQRGAAWAEERPLGALRNLSQGPLGIPKKKPHAARDPVFEPHGGHNPL